MSQHTRAVCIREIQRSIKESVKRLLEDKIEKLGVGASFDILETEIRGPHGSLIIFQGMQSHTADSIKSLEGYRIAWVEEAHTLSERSLKLLRPTIRSEGSEIWFSWNPESEDAPIDQLLRGPNRLTDAIVVEANWRDNPWFPDVLKAEMESDRGRDYDSYLHIWEGHYRRALEGAVYAKQLREAYEQKRVCRVLPIPGKPVDVFFDLGHRDHTSLWFAQVSVGEYRILDFYQNRGEMFEHYAQAAKNRGYAIGTVWLPHDARQQRLTGKTVEQTARDLFPNTQVRVIPRMAKKHIGIDAARRIFPNCYFDENKTKEGLKCLSKYRFKIDDSGAYSKDPLHDENSDAADAFAQLALSLTEKPKKQADDDPISYGSWMAM